MALGLAVNAATRAAPTAVKLWGKTVAQANRFFKAKPAALMSAKTALKLPGTASRTAVLKTICENPITTLLTLSAVPDLLEFVGVLDESAPELMAMVNAVQESDTVQSLSDPSIKVRANEIISDRNAQVANITIGQLDAFRDEAELIGRVLARMPGNTESLRMTQLLELRKVFAMPVSNFSLYQTMKSFS